MTISVDDIYRVQEAVWKRFHDTVLSKELGWPDWSRFVEENGLRSEGGVLDFQLHQGGLVSVLDPSNYGRLWMSEDFALKILFLGHVP